MDFCERFYLCIDFIAFLLNQILDYITLLSFGSGNNFFAQGIAVFIVEENCSIVLNTNGNAYRNSNPTGRPGILA